PHDASRYALVLAERGSLSRRAALTRRGDVDVDLDGRGRPTPALLAAQDVRAAVDQPELTDARIERERDRLEETRRQLLERRGVGQELRHRELERAGAPRLGLDQLSFDRRMEARQARLEEIVVDPGLQRL